MTAENCKVLTEADAAADVAGTPRPSVHDIMPVWQCHKQVRALKIRNITWRGSPPEDSNYLLDFEDASYAPLPVLKAYVHKHNPQPGGYYVVYEDGYASYSPAKAFEEGYTHVVAKGTLPARQPSLEERVAQLEKQVGTNKARIDAHFYEISKGKERVASDGMAAALSNTPDGRLR